MGGFIREGSSDDYVLLGGGGHKLLSEIIETPYNAEIEYIESSGTQWIDTLYKPNNNTRVICDFQFTQSNDWPRIFGCSEGSKWNTVPTFQLDFEDGVTTGKLGIMIGNNTGWTRIDIAGDFNRHTYELNTTKLIYDSTEVATLSDQTFQCTADLAIFTRRPGNTTPSQTNSAYGKLYSFKIYESDELVRDFIPVRVGQIGYLYDRVSKQLFGNAGTGDFVLGPDQYYLPLTGGTLTGHVGATGFIKSDSSDSYVLLGGGGHKLESDLSVGYAGSTRVATILGNIDNRNTDNLPSYYYANSLGGAGAVSSELAYTGSAHGWNETRITTVPWWDTSGGRPVQLALADSGAYLRTAASRTQWNQWQTIITSANIGNYMRNIYDAEIEYLESTGTQWINTLYKPNNNTRITCDFQYTQSNNYPRIFGCSTGTEYNDVPTVQLDFETGVTTGKLQFMIGNDANWTRTDITGDFNRHTYDFNTTRLIYDGTQVATYPDQTFQLITNLAIFAKVGPNYNPYPMEYASGKLYSFKIYESDELVRDFIPVRVGQVGYLYDKVSSQLFGNAGAGNFVLGQDTVHDSNLTYPYLPLGGGTITGNLTVNGNRCFLCNTTHPDAHMNISDSAQIVKTNESYNPYLLFHLPNVSCGRIEYSSSQFHFKNGETYTDYMPLYANSFNQTSDIRKKNIVADININIYDIANAPLFKFTWKNENRYSGLHVGSSAQYWQTILPELTSIANDSDQTLSMQYDVISLVSEIIVAKKAVEHEQKISYLESQITQLRNKLKNLKQCNKYVNNE